MGVRLAPPSNAAICATVYLRRRRARRAARGVPDLCRGLLLRPRARAAARPSWVPSTISSRWNSSIAASTWKTSRPCGVVVSIACLRTTRPTPRAARSSASALQGIDAANAHVELLGTELLDGLGIPVGHLPLLG